MKEYLMNQEPSNPNTEPIPETPKKKLLSQRDFYIVAVFFLAVMGLLFYGFFFPNYYDGEAPRIFDLEEGMSFSRLCEELESQGIIPNKTMLRVAGFVYGAEQRIKAGRYAIPNGLSYLDLLDLLTEGKSIEKRKLLIYGGMSTRNLIARTVAILQTDSAKLKQLITDRVFLDSIQAKVPNLEGYLLPMSYSFYPHERPEVILQTMWKEFSAFFDEKLQARAIELGFVPHDIMTMASIIAGETIDTTEMPTISGVYHNRLKKNMKLQADPTIAYILGGYRRLLHRDLEIESPYNTYKYAGLPPGPINNPGRNAIIAALYPREHNYLFFVADSNGRHNFSETYGEHLLKAREYHRWLNSRK